MNLGFSKTFPRGKTLKGKPTGFVKKIKRGEKIHTIREDKTNRWKQGNKIHCFTGLRTKKCKLFYLAECKGTQEINIFRVYAGMGIVRCFKGAKRKLFKLNAKIENFPIIIRQNLVFIDGKQLTSYQIRQLAKNDGFKNSTEFFEWFDKDFEGKIIHFTNLRY